MNDHYLKLMEELWKWRASGKISTSQEFELLMYLLRQWKETGFKGNRFAIDLQETCNGLQTSKRSFERTSSGLIDRGLLATRYDRKRKQYYCTVMFSGVKPVSRRKPKPAEPKVPKKKKPRTKIRASIPEFEEWMAFAKEKGFPAYEAERTFNYYESVGWKIGKARKPVERWKSCMNTCISNYKDRGGQMVKPQDPANKPPADWRNIYQILWPGRPLITQWQALDPDDHKDILAYAKKRKG